MVQVGVDGDGMKGMALRTEGGNLKGGAGAGGSGDGIAALRRNEGVSSPLAGRFALREPSARANSVMQLGPGFLGVQGGPHVTD